MLEYSLRENALTNCADDYQAQVHNRTSYNKEEVIDLMLQRGTLTTKTDLLAVINNLEETVKYIVENGGTVNMPLFNTGFAISGVFTGATDVFDPARHRAHITFRPGALLRASEKSLKLTKVNVALPQPEVLEVKDSISGSVDDKLTSGGVAEIVGVNIKISGKNPSCGIYLVAEDGAMEAKVNTIVANKPSTLTVVLPALVPGNKYRLKIVTQYQQNNRDSKEPKVTAYRHWLQAV
jgi:hypothetical protein